MFLLFLYRRVLREKGNFSTVIVRWQIFARANDTLLPAQPQEDFEIVTEFVVFQDGQTEAYIELAVITDGLPELVEEFEMHLVDATVSGDISIKPSIDFEASNSSLSIQESDDPYGLFGFSTDSQGIEIAEDIPIDDSFSGIAMLNVTRKRGIFGTVSV